MLVKDVMIPAGRLITISPMAKVRDALILMREKRVKSIVVEKGHDSDAYGLITFKNILYSIVASDGDIDLLRVYDICSKPAYQLSGNLDIKYAAQMMVQSSVKRLLVIDNNQLEGILTMTDILGVVMENLE